MSRYLLKIFVSVAAISIAMAVFLTACGGTSAFKPVPAPSPVPAPPPEASPKVDPAVLQAKGEEIFQKTGAGGVGCKACHGTDGKGIANTAPEVRGKTADDIKRALGGDAMSFIRMTNEDIDAVAVYLKYLQTQP